MWDMTGDVGGVYHTNGGEHTCLRGVCSELGSWWGHFMSGGAWHGTGVICDMATGEQCFSLIVDGSGLIWDAFCIVCGGRCGGCMGHHF